ncbi:MULTISPECIES: LLM class flavin-dependent oxidoreductase [Rhizobium]|uniref:LLM class flavin-dependent oxidoreductase n=1 Tax=Rhizobium leguminosarum bv. viciae TaxID=387 RepID=A0A8G2IT07_RHILV|nr:MULTISPECIES: LLM class flavin-dependent oxidoreductase [Rhizobium]MBY5323173.1 LLM class flavin-dependent oxidoreductase [Rhizobium leguminosarum]MBY5384366.1 LLM class flavin-dependent oxidoreductase [Rhizobium leguminosarum]MBY5391563.1 LLM class flavin-dependent oxidoreductase [Rhizobium leguminosarum]MBY5415967.1 LLM class flavin-dependent oxidoreductase [Rhizobium leguminosarum]MBY5433452.1 LLM class flavin-dependent oxidoreductase [Rhizobium leguminosarum]
MTRVGNISISHIGFLTPGNYPDDDPLSGLEQTLEQLQYGEDLGFDSAWVRQRHLEPGISSASAFLAAATQRTSRIELGTAVIPIGYESPYRLAEDLATVDVLSRGRLNIGVSAGRPLHADLIAPLVFDGDWTGFDFSHDRVLRFADNLRGSYLGDEQTLIKTPFGPQRPRLQPYAKGLIDRIWYGGGSQRSAEWAGRNGFNLLTGNVITGEGTDDFFIAQSRLIETHRGAETQRRVALGRVIVPFDSADAATRRRYRDYANGRHERTLSPQGERRTLFARDVVGTSEEILAQLFADPILPEVSELRLELPYEFEHEQYRQILHDFATLIAPELGWKAPSDIRAAS